ncbi:MAG: hypothetical protein LBH06_08885 [Rikenellaceae bacterium]|jgi:hypothetical protein|nr:hypothetical protein [Rikenellaceae bacterium]
MNVLFSKRLEATLFNMQGGYMSPMRNCICLDKLFLALMSDYGSHGSLIINTMLKDWELERVLSRIELALSDGSGGVCCAVPREFRDYITERLRMVCGEDLPCTITTGHVIFALLGDRRLNTARILEKYAVTPMKVFLSLMTLPMQEDFVRPQAKSS